VCGEVCVIVEQSDTQCLRGVVPWLVVSGLVRWGLVTIRKSLVAGGGSFNSCHKMLWSVLPFLNSKKAAR
jgi:hypothetical protein